jgi:hypothetical protein
MSCCALLFGLINITTSPLVISNLVKIICGLAWWGELFFLTVFRFLKKNRIIVRHNKLTEILMIADKRFVC